MGQPAFERRHGKGAGRALSSPLTTEADYTPEELEFLRAMDMYKTANHRPFPTWREVYRVFISLGYSKGN